MLVVLQYSSSLTDPECALEVSWSREGIIIQLKGNTDKEDARLQSASHRGGQLPPPLLPRGGRDTWPPWKWWGPRALTLNVRVQVNLSRGRTALWVSGFHNPGCLPGLSSPFWKETLGKTVPILLEPWELHLVAQVGPWDHPGEMGEVLPSLRVRALT